MSDWAVHQNPRPDRAAKAPYNFVPLPQRVVTVDPTSLPDQDRYYPDSDWHTGWIDCELTTASPLYVRAALEQDEFERSLDEKAEERRPWPEQVRNKPDFFYADDRSQPVIPGSSLRGMLRTLVEIAGYGKMQWVTDQQHYFYRAVAAARSDPLREPYQEALGAFGRNVQAGYLERRGDDWYVWPALAPQTMGWPERGAYLKVKEHQIKQGSIPGYVDFNDSRYDPGWYEVSFDVQVRQGKRGQYVWISQIGPLKAGYAHPGVLVCSGNMLETGQKGQKSPRRNHALVLLRDNKAKKPLKISANSVKDYLAGLTPFQKEALGLWGGPQWGCLKDGAPVFYVAEGDEVVYFGHSPNFRVPFRRRGGRRASSPMDYVPEALHREPDTDLAEAIFGYTKSQGEGKEGAYAGRVFVTDARLRGGQGRVWLAGDDAVVPRILGSPKPTTFQHYLVQTTPNESASLSHYGSDTPEETVIRGHKLYWHKGAVGVDDIQEEDPEDNRDTQHTQIRPVRAGITFDFRIYFENLSSTELGALLWVLDKAQDDAYRLKLGMGKPYGMGAVKIESKLHLTDRAQRYRQLFEGKKWAEGTKPEGELAREAIEKFEQLILSDSVLNPRGIQSLDKVERIQALLALLGWTGPDREQTRYLLIEHPERGNEYKERPVLPDPLAVSGAHVRERQPPRRPQPPLRTGQRPTPIPPSARPRRIHELQVGTVLKGTVRRIMPFGAFVDIGVGRDGLVHVSELSDGFVGSVEEVVNVGDEVTVRVINVDVRRNRIGLSMKGME
ncbi:MAG: TIGR03986 family CRISPR-associated RAMP protein [Ardenticatenia bacterium]|nr:TIGR03986 family CRISPR-associated RAMP protein [Ardenticatenia bacterium]